MRTLRVGMVGHGFMGKTHGHAYRSLGYYYDPVPARVVLAGVSARTESTRRRALEEWGYEFAVRDFSELCARDDIDIIDCAVPNCLHRDVLLAALANGKHVYMDKPLCVSLSEAREMAAAAAAHPECVTQMTFNYRFVPALIRARELAQSGALGRLYSVRVCYLHAGYVSPSRPFTWRLDAGQSGPSGALYDLGAHVVDLLRYVAGEVAQVQCTTETFTKERPLRDDPGTMARVEVDDLALLLLRMANGALGTLEASRVAMGVQDEIRLEAHGDRGAIRFNLMQPNFLEYYDGTLPEGDYGAERGFKLIECVARYPKPASYPGPKNALGWERSHIHSIWNFVRHVAEGSAASPDIAEGARTQAVMEAALVSAKTGGWEAVPGV